MASKPTEVLSFKNDVLLGLEMTKSVELKKTIVSNRKECDFSMKILSGPRTCRTVDGFDRLIKVQPEVRL